MSTTIPYGEPASIRAGDTITWKRSLSDYPAGTWTLSYSLLSASAKISITTSASGTDHLVSVAKATTAAYTAGWYDWVASVTDGTSRYTVDYGRIEVLPDLAAATTYDNRTHARTMLEAIEALLEGRATNDQLDLINVSHNARNLQRNPGELLALRDKYRVEVQAEEQAERIRNGLGSGRNIKVRFV